MERLALKEDWTSTDGRVMGGSSDWYAEDGRPFALAEDLATCGNCKGLWRIVGTARDCMDKDRAMVKDLDPVHCPCSKNRVFASGNSPFFWSEGGSTAARTPAPAPAPQLIYNEQFALAEYAGQRLAGVRYRVRVGADVIASGVTDARGRTQRIPTSDARRLTLEITGSN
jgi:hypothetical protein